MISAMLAACESGSEGSEAKQLPALTAATLGQQTVLGADEYLTTAPYDTADRDNGKRLAVMCLACHSIEQGGRHMIGPNLHDFFGSKVASRGGYDYSAAVSEADFTWTPRALDAWLAQPASFLPGNRMTFAGVRHEQDRNDLIAYLLEATSGKKE